MRIVVTAVLGVSLFAHASCGLQRSDMCQDQCDPTIEFCAFWTNDVGRYRPENQECRALPLACQVAPSCDCVMNELDSFYNCTIRDSGVMALQEVVPLYE